MKKPIGIILLMVMLLSFLPNAFAAETLAAVLSENGATDETADMITAIYKNDNALLYMTEDKDEITEFFEQIAQFSITPKDGNEMTFTELTTDSMYIRIRVNKEGPSDYRSIFIKDGYIVIANTKLSGIQVVATNQKFYTVENLNNFIQTVNQLRNKWANIQEADSGDSEYDPNEPLPTPSPVSSSPATPTTTTSPSNSPEPRQRAVLENIKKYYTGEFTITLSEDHKSGWLREFVGSGNTLKLRFGVLNGTHTEMDTRLYSYADEFNGFRGYFYLELVGSQKSETWLSFKKEKYDTVIFDSGIILDGDKILSYSNYPDKQYSINLNRITLTFDVDMQRSLKALTANIFYQPVKNKDEYTHLGEPIPVNMSSYQSSDSMDFMIYGNDINGDGKWSITFLDLSPKYYISNYDESKNFNYIEGESGYIMEFDLKLDSSHKGSWLQSQLGNNIHAKWDIRKGAQMTIMELTGESGAVFRGYSSVLSNDYDGRLHQFKSNFNIYKEGEKRYDGRKYEGGFITEIQYNDDNTIKDIVFTLIRPLISPAKNKQKYYTGNVLMMTEGVMTGNQVSIDMSTFKASGNSANLVLMRRSENRGDISYASLDERIWIMRQQPYFGLLRYVSPDNGDIVDFTVDYAMEFKAFGQTTGDRDYEWLNSYPWREEILSEGSKDITLSFVSIQRYLNGAPTYPMVFLRLKGDIGEKWFINAGGGQLKKGETDHYKQYEAVKQTNLSFDFAPLEDFVGFNFYEMSTNGVSLCLTIEFEDNGSDLAQAGFFGGYPLDAQTILAKDINYTGDAAKLYYKWTDYDNWEQKYKEVGAGE